MALFKRKSKEPNSIEKQITAMEEALVVEDDQSKRFKIEEELGKLYDLRSKRAVPGFRVSPDALFKGLVAVGFALIGYTADKHGSIIPKWSLDASRKL